MKRLGARERGGAAFEVSAGSVTVTIYAALRADPPRIDRRATLAAIARATHGVHP